MSLIPAAFGRPTPPETPSMVIHPCYWNEDTEPKLGVETIELLRGFEFDDI
jgi:hypothetical protein